MADGAIEPPAFPIGQHADQGAGQFVIVVNPIVSLCRVEAMAPAVSGHKNLLREKLDRG